MPVMSPIAFLLLSSFIWSKITFGNLKFCIIRTSLFLILTPSRSKGNKTKEKNRKIQSLSHQSFTFLLLLLLLLELMYKKFSFSRKVSGQYEPHNHNNVNIGNTNHHLFLFLMKNHHFEEPYFVKIGIITLNCSLVIRIIFPYDLEMGPI